LGAAILSTRTTTRHLNVLAESLACEEKTPARLARRRRKLATLDLREEAAEPKHFQAKCAAVRRPETRRTR
jgi:hypothetical protein